MRVVIWADMEGVAGISTWEQVGGSLPLYEEGRRLYTEEINAAVRGALAAGATEVVVIDGHGGSHPGARGFLSLIPERIEPGARYVLGHTWTRHIEPLERGCDAALLVAAHAMSGTPGGVLSHTVSSESWYAATINGTEVGETGIVAAIAGCWNTPVVFLSGDEAVCREAQALLGPELVTAAVKQGLGRFSARHLAPAEARALIESRVREALVRGAATGGAATGGAPTGRQGWPSPLRFAAPVTFQVELTTPDKAEAFRGRAGVEVVGPRTVRAIGENFWHAWDAFWHHG
ncbi:MAG: peptidase M55 [Armatimonadetes bacterium]|nr:peptidase M55 [Armatimonadota bacterium]